MLGTHTHTHSTESNQPFLNNSAQGKGVGRWGEISENGSLKYKKQPMHIHCFSNFRKSWTETTAR